MSTNYSPLALDIMRRETAGTYADMSEAAFTLAGIQLNPDRLPSISLAQIVERYAGKISKRTHYKWLAVDSDGDVFLYSERPDTGELFDMWHSMAGQFCIGNIRTALRNHLRLATNWREYLIEVNQ